jgi:hypothetical protein
VTRPADYDYPLWRTGNEGRGLYLAEAGPRIRLSHDILQDLLDSMPLFPVALVAADFTACPNGCYEPGQGSVGAILRFRLDGGRRLVYRITRFSLISLEYKLCWPD